MSKWWLRWRRKIVMAFAIAVVILFRFTPSAYLCAYIQLVGKPNSMSRSTADVQSVSGSQHRVGSEPTLETLLPAQLFEYPRSSGSWLSQRSSAIERLLRANAKQRCNNAHKPEARHAVARPTPRLKRRAGKESRH